MHEFWEIDEVPNASPNSTDDRQCEDHFATTHFRNDDRRFVVSLPFNDNINQLYREVTDATESFPLLQQCSIPRQPIIKGAAQYELLGFVGASTKAYGACLFIRSIHPDDTTSARLLTSKPKVAPFHDMSIPRKELCADLLLVTLWPDDTVTAELRRLTDSYQWSYVRSHLNPADIISRDMLPINLTTNELWWDGPNFIDEPIKLKPHNEIPDNELPELKPSTVATTAIIEQQLPVFRKYDSFRKLQRVIAWVHRFVNNLWRKPTERVLTKTSTISELRQSLLVIVWVVQHIKLGDEIQRIQSKPCKRIGQLNPIYSDIIIRVGGRLSRSRLPDKSKHQLILPHMSLIMELLIRTMHIEQLHVGPSRLLATIRQRFWLTNARSTIRKGTRSCVTCFRTNPIDITQLMGELPKQRVLPTSPFSVTGVDYAGPFLVKQGSYRQKHIKAYIAVFVCLSTKVIHLELVSDLTTDAYLAALRRFVGQYGIPPEIHSYIGTNFHGTKNELHQLRQQHYEQFRQDPEVNRFTQYCQVKEIVWHFIPPGAPQFGDLWEATVKSTNTHLKRIVDDPADPEVITPAHFLIMRCKNAIPEPSINDVKINRLDRWQHCQLMRERFWRAWSRDYLTRMQPRKKNWTTKDNAKPSMVVHLHDKKRPPWKYGRVTSVYPGDDNLFRAVDVLNEGAIFRRPITNLSILSIKDYQRLLINPKN